MSNIDFIKINNFSDLHNGKDIFFCKTDFLQEDFNTISSLNNDVLLITGNADYGITDDIVNQAPKNIKTWYAENALSNHHILKPMPLGMENKEYSERSGHGVGYQQRVQEKEDIINNLTNQSPDRNLYANFNVGTNPEYRSVVKNVCLQSSDIDWQECDLSLKDFFETITLYKMVVCPIGNGVDTHRLWEVLYCNRIPVTVKVGNFKIYELYEKLPIIILPSLDHLLDTKYVLQQYEEIKNKKYDMSILNSDFWRKSIIQDAKNINIR
jgi:hypothetical protein